LTCTKAAPKWATWTRRFCRCPLPNRHKCRGRPAPPGCTPFGWALAVGSRLQKRPKIKEKL